MTPTPQVHRAWKLFVLTLFSALSLSCTIGSDPYNGNLYIQSRAKPDVLTVGGFDTGIYSLDDPSSITVVLTDGPRDHPDRALIVRMFWRPKAAATPLDETATNTTVQYIVFGDRPGDTQGGASDSRRVQVGIYSGGGFLYPETDLGAQTLQANLWQATLSLADKSDGFEDTLGPSIMRGRFTARRDDLAIIDAVRRVNIAVSEALGVPRFVRAD